MWGKYGRATGSEAVKSKHGDVRMLREITANVCRISRESQRFGLRFIEKEK